MYCNTNENKGQEININTSKGNLSQAMDSAVQLNTGKTHILRQRRNKLDVFSRHRVLKAHFGAVQGMARYKLALAAVKVVAQQRVTYVCHVAADLVGLACFKP